MHDDLIEKLIARRLLLPEDAEAIVKAARSVRWED